MDERAKGWIINYIKVQEGKKLLTMSETSSNTSKDWIEQSANPAEDKTSLELQIQMQEVAMEQEALDVARKVLVDPMHLAFAGNPQLTTHTC